MKYDEILEVMDIYHSEMGCKVFLIDNIMRLDLRNLDRDPYEAQSQFINSISDFSQTRSVHVHVVAHPRKVMGSIITKMDVAGSGDLTNRADNVLAVHRVTPAYAEEMRKNLKGNQALLNSILKASNILEVFKCRDTGEQDIYIPLQFQTESKRLTDMSSPALKDKIYSWDDKSVWLNDAMQTKLPF
jgi:twinkle protein